MWWWMKGQEESSLFVSMYFYWTSGILFLLQGKMDVKLQNRPAQVTFGEPSQLNGSWVLSGSGKVQAQSKSQLQQTQVYISPLSLTHTQRSTHAKVEPKTCLHTQLY